MKSKKILKWRFLIPGSIVLDDDGNEGTVIILGTKWLTVRFERRTKKYLLQGTRGFDLHVVGLSPVKPPPGWEI